MDAEREVRELNERYYQAFEAADIDAMSDLWEHSDRVVCTHPGWATLRGWGAVASSWVALFQTEHHNQFVLTQLRCQVTAEAAWVSLDENLLGDQAGVTVATLNLFVREPDGRWLMAGHHGSVVAAVMPE